MSWEASWTSPAGAEAQMIEMIEMILQRGLEAAKAKTEG